LPRFALELGATLRRSSSGALTCLAKIHWSRVSAPLLDGGSAADSSATDQSNLTAKATFAYHVGDALIQSLGFPPGNKAKADNGDVVTVIGSPVEQEAGQPSGPCQELPDEWQHRPRGRRLK